MLECLIILALFVLHLFKLLWSFGIFLAPTFFNLKLILQFITTQYLDFVTTRYIATKYGPHLCKQTLHCFGGFVTRTFYLENYFACKNIICFLCKLNFVQ